MSTEAWTLGGLIIACWVLFKVAAGIFGYERFTKIGVGTYSFQTIGVFVCLIQQWTMAGCLFICVTLIAEAIQFRFLSDRLSSMTAAQNKKLKDSGITPDNPLMLIMGMTWECAWILGAHLGSEVTIGL